MRLSFASAWHALRFGSTMPTRCMLALAATLFSIMLLAASHHFVNRPVIDLMIACRGQYVWSAIFGIDALLLVCRIVDQHPRIGISRIVNAITCGIWFGFIVATFEIGHISPDDSAEIVLALAAAWCALRTDLTLNDRETA